MTLHYWAMGAVLFSQPMIPSHWLPSLAGLWGLTMVNKQIRQCRALYIAIVLIEGLSLAFSTWFKLWKNILIRIYKVYLVLLPQAPVCLSRTRKNRSSIGSLHFTSLWWEDSVRRGEFILGLSLRRGHIIGTRPDGVLSILGHSWSIFFSSQHLVPSSVTCNETISQNGKLGLKLKKLS